MKRLPRYRMQMCEANYAPDMYDACANSDVEDLEAKCEWQEARLKTYAVFCDKIFGDIKTLETKMHKTLEEEKVRREEKGGRNETER